MFQLMKKSWSGFRNSIRHKGCQEEGEVAWIRNIENALELSEISGKPVFLLFQEIPGCTNCTRFGKLILSNKNVVEMITKNFIACIVNNRGISKKDANALKRFQEPYLNNPVVRIVNHSGNDIIPRISECYESDQMMKFLAQALDQFIRVQSYKKQLMFEMTCFWEGQGCCDYVAQQFTTGSVSSTTAGWLGNKEVVVVEFGGIDISSFLQDVVKFGIMSNVYYSGKEMENVLKEFWGGKITKMASFQGTWKPSKESDQHFFLKKSPYSGQYGQMSEIQRICLNGYFWASNYGYAHFPGSTEISLKLDHLMNKM